MERFTLALLFFCTALSAGSVNAQSNELISQSGFGYSVDVNGSRIFVGEPLNKRIPGMVYVFEGSGQDWSLSATLHAAEGSVGDNFGSALASGGDLLFVGSPGSDAIEGGVYVFSDNGGSDWKQTGVIRPDSAAPGDEFARVLAFAAGRLFVSERPAEGTPRVLVYEMDSNVDGWLLSHVIRPDGDGDHSAFGASLAADGQTLYVGSPQNAGGVVHVYSPTDAGEWTQAALLSGSGKKAPVGLVHASSPSSEAFGSRLRLDGNHLFVTAPASNGYSGRVYSFVRTEDGAFERGPNLTAFDSYGGQSFARDVASAGDEVLVSVLAPHRDGGTVYALRLNADGDEVVSARKLSEPRVLPFSYYGESMDADKGLLAVAAHNDVFDAGAVYLYRRDPESGDWASGPKLMSPDQNGYTSVRGGKVKCEDGSADGFGCDHVDLVSFVTDEDLGMERGIRTNDLWGWTDPDTGKEYALVGRNDGTSFVDLSDPVNPVVVGFLPRTAGSPPSIWRDIKVYKGYAFIVSDQAGHHGVQIFDLKQLGGVADPPAVFEETAHYDRIYSAHNIVIDEETGFAYTVGNSQGGETCGGGSHIINIQDPTHPKFAGCFAHEGTGRAGTGYTHDAQCVVYRGPDERYDGHEICFASNETAVSIADMSDKSNPVIVARGDYPNPGYTHQGWLSEDQRYFFVDDELDEINGTTDGTRTLIWDVAELDDPVLVNEYVSANKASDHNLYVKGNLMYQSNYVSGLHVVDVSNVEAPIEVGHFDTVPWGSDKPGFGGSWSNYPFFKSGLIIVSSGEEGLFVLKRSRIDS